MNQKGPVILRQRRLPSGNVKLYLDIYTDGRRRSESLGLFLVPERTATDRSRNRETMRLAEAVAAQRTLDIHNRRFGFSTASDVLFYPLFDKWIAGAKKQKTAELNGYLRYFLRRFEPSDGLLMSRIDRQWCRDFAASLTTGYYGRPLSENSKASLWYKFCAFIHFAMEQEVMATDPTKGLRPYRKVRQTEIKYLTVEELRRLSETPCRDDLVRRMFLFSCFTGLRISDVETLTWDEVSEDMSVITFRQTKTGGLEYLSLNPQAAELMGPRGKGTVFEHTYRNRIAMELDRWVSDAGIDKHITFHCARHTFATMLLTMGADIYTVSKLLGHSDISVTQVYAKVIDKKREQAVAMIPKIL